MSVDPTGDIYLSPGEERTELFIPIVFSVHNMMIQPASQRTPKYQIQKYALLYEYHLPNSAEVGCDIQPRQRRTVSVFLILQ